MLQFTEGSYHLSRCWQNFSSPSSCFSSLRLTRPHKLLQGFEPLKPPFLYWVAVVKIIILELGGPWSFWGPGLQPSVPIGYCRPACMLYFNHSKTIQPLYIEIFYSAFWLPTKGEKGRITGHHCTDYSRREYVFFRGPRALAPITNLLESINLLKSHKN